MNSKLPAPSGIFEFHVRRTFLVTCLVASLACAHDSQGGTPTRGVLVSMTRITVTPTPENNPSVTWDASARESQGGEGCGLLVALDFVAAPLGGVASAVCSMASSGGGGSERAQQDPDLFVRIRAGSTTYSSPVISDRASHDLVYSLFIPREALRDDGLELGIYDLDGDDERQSMLIADVSLREHQLDGRLELRGKDLDEPSLALLRLDFDDPPRSSQHNLSMSADDGLVPVRGLELAAGMAVEIRASGRYRIGSWNDAMLGPAGYPNGGPREYNLPGQVFGRARHGAAVALVQRDSAAQAIVVGECVRFVTESGGTLYLGVNDEDFRNNEGQIAFAVDVSTPSASEWQQGSTRACQ